MRIRLVRPLLVLAALAVVLAACSTPPPTAPDEPSVDGSTYALYDAAPEAIAVGFVMLAPEFLAAGVSAAELAELAPGVFAGEFVVVAGDGTFSVPLPAAADIPAATLVPLADAVTNFGGCTVDASPLAAEASVTLFEGLSIPGLLAVTAEGTALMFAAEAELESEAEFDATFYGWIFVDRDATLSATGCDVEADLELTEGWNQLAWSQVELTTFVEVVPATEVFAAVALMFPQPAAVVSSDGAE